MSHESGGAGRTSGNSSKLATNSKSHESKKLYSRTNSDCRESFKWASQLSKHKKICTKPSRQQNKFELLNGRFKCFACSKSYAHRPNILRHLKSCEGSQASGNVHECSHCNKTFSYRSKLERHIDQVHSTESVNCRKCSICGYKSRRKDHLEAHRKKCSGIRGQNNINENEILDNDLELKCKIGGFKFS